MHILHDPDEWKAVTVGKPCSSCGGDINRCNGMCNGEAGYSLVRRPTEEVAAIKAEKRRLHEDEVLAEADAIRATRALAAQQQDRPIEGE